MRSALLGGGEIMSAVQIAMMAGLPYTALRDAILTHPTLNKGLKVLFSSAPTVFARVLKLEGFGKRKRGTI
jgi:hypothetical protein